MCLEGHVRNLLNVQSLREFDRFFRAAGIRAGQILSHAEITREIEVAPNTAGKWIPALQTSGQIFVVSKAPHAYPLSEKGIAIPGTRVGQGVAEKAPSSTRTGR